MRIMAGEAVSRAERLSLVRLLHGRILYVVAVDAKCGRVFHKMKIEFALAALARLVYGVAGFAAHVEGWMAAAFLWNVEPLFVAGETEIVFFVPRCFLQ